MSKPRADIVLFCALPVEYSALAEFLPERSPYRHSHGDICEIGTFSAGVRTWSIALVETGRGNPATAGSVQRFIEFLSPRSVFFIGVAGGIKDVTHGDLVVADQVFYYEPGKVTGTGFRPRAAGGRADHSLKEFAKALSRGLEWKKRAGPSAASSNVLLEPIASGEKVITTDDEKEEAHRILTSYYSHAVAVETEGYGFHEAAHRCTTPALLIRGISDRLSDKQQADATGSQPIASRHAAAFAFELLSMPFFLDWMGGASNESPDKPQGGPPHNLSSNLSPNFVGRDEDLAKLAALIETKQTTAISAIHGMGGVGKTELAQQFAARQLAAFPGGVCRIHARENISLQLVDFASGKLGIAPLANTSPDDNAKHVLHKWPGEGRVLLIVDNLPEIRDLPAYFTQADGRFRVLLTTRQRISDARIALLDLNVLETEPALELLRSLIGAERIEDAAAKDLLEWLGYLPLAIDLVGAYLAENTELTLDEFLEELKQTRLTHESLDSETQKQFRIDAPPGLIDALELSRRELNPTELALAGMLSVCAQAPIPRELVYLAGWEYKGPGFVETTWRRVVQGLINRSLLQKEDGEFYILHPLVREFFQMQPTTDDHCRRATALSLVRQAKQVEMPLTRSMAAEIVDYVPHWQWAADELHPYLEGEDITWPHTALAWYFNLMNDVRSVEHMYKSALRLNKARFGPDHPHTAISLNNLAELYHSQGHYAEAETLYDQAFSIFKEQLGPQHIDTVVVLSNIARLYNSQGAYKQAELLLVPVLRVFEKQLGPKHTETAVVLNTLANSYSAQGNHAKAEPLYQRVLKIRERELGPEHPMTATTLNDLGRLYLAQSLYAKAESFLQRAHSICTIQLGLEHPDTELSVINLAELYQSQGLYEKAVILYAGELSIRLTELGPEHPSTKRIHESFVRMRAKM